MIILDLHVYPFLVIRKLQDFESPYISQRNIKGALKIMLRRRYVFLTACLLAHFRNFKGCQGHLSCDGWDMRRDSICATTRPNDFIVPFSVSYWDIDYDLELMRDLAALNLLYVQTISDIEKGWIFCNRGVREQLATLQARGAKREVGLSLVLSPLSEKEGCIICLLDYFFCAVSQILFSLLFTLAVHGTCSNPEVLRLHAV